MSFKYAGISRKRESLSRDGNEKQKSPVECVREIDSHDLKTLQECILSEEGQMPIQEGG